MMDETLHKFYWDLLNYTLEVYSAE